MKTRPVSWQVWNIACLHADATTWSTQISGVKLTSRDAYDQLTKHIGERRAHGWHPVISAVICNTETKYMSQYNVNPRGGLEVI